MNVKNTGKRAGDAVVQLYVSLVGSQVSRPRQQLAGFQRVTLRPGETRAVTLPLRADQIAYSDVAAHEFVVERDQVQVKVGQSSADIKPAKTVPVAP